MAGLAVNFCAAVTSLGLDVETACAAARGGLVRTPPFKLIPVSAPDPGEVEYPITCPVPIISSGYIGAPRLEVLLGWVVRELAAKLSSLVTGPVPVFVGASLPDLRRVYTGLQLRSGEPSDIEHRLETAIRKARPDAARFENAIVGCLDGVRNLKLLEFEPYWSGSTGVAECILAAAQRVNNHPEMVVIVVAVDTFVSVEDIEWLLASRRLKTASMPVGLLPGEAAVALCITHPSHALSQLVRSGLLIDSAKTELEPNSLLSGKSCSAEALSNTVSMSGLSGSDVPHFFMFSDHNGEPYRANEFGWLLHRMTDLGGLDMMSAVWFPASSFGHLGSAYGGVAICQAQQAFERGYAPAQTALVLASSDDELRSAIVLQYSNGHP